MKKKVDCMTHKVCEHCYHTLSANPTLWEIYKRILSTYIISGNPVFLSNLFYLNEGFDFESILHTLEARNYIKTIDTNQDILILPKTKRTSEGEILCTNSSLECAKRVHLFEENNFNQLGNCLD
jgi:hypothetical protein